MIHRHAHERFENGTLLNVDLDTLRQDFRRLRRKHGLSQADVADLLHVSQATISTFEQARATTLRHKTLREIHTMVEFWNSQKHDAPTSKAIVQLDPTHNIPIRCTACEVDMPPTPNPIRFCPYCAQPVKSENNPPPKSARKLDQSGREKITALLRSALDELTEHNKPIE